MKDEWLNDLRSQLSHPSAKAPEGLWDDIERALPPRRPRMASYKLWAAASGIAAAVAVVLAFVFYRDNGTDNLMQPDFAEMPKAAYKTSAKSVGIIKNTVRQDVPNRVEKLTASVSRKDVSSSDSKKKSEIFSDVPTETPENVQESESTESPVNNIRDEKQHDSGNEKEPDYVGESNWEPTLSQSDDAKSRLTLSVAAGNPFGTMHSESSSMLTANIYPQLAGTASNDSMILKSPRLKHVAESPISMKHHLPVKLGIKVRYSLTKVLSLETGLTYSLLKADGSGYRLGREVQATQQLHYLGIPVNAVLSLWDYRRFSLYATAGAEVEKCISGRMEYKIYDRTGETFATERSSATVKPLQFSANASLGLQLSLTDKLGLYVEPGINYYFKNGSSIETYYSEKPFNFSLLTGFRLSF